MILFSDNLKIEEGPSISRSIVVRAGEKLDLAIVAKESGDAEFNIDIQGSGAEVRLRGLYVCEGEEEVNIRVNMIHSIGGSVSNQLFKGVVGGSAKVNFDGRIVVAHDAQKTEAYQTNQSLLLSDTADVQTSPQLEIYADDVKCSHGATVGSLNEDEQFYMRSRGITLEETKKLQIISFLAPVMEGLPEETVLK